MEDSKAVNPIADTAKYILEVMFELLGPGPHDEEPKYDNLRLLIQTGQKIVQNRGTHLHVQEFADSMRYLESINAIKTILSVHQSTVEGVTVLLWHGRYLYSKLQEQEASSALPSPNIINIVGSVSNSQLQQGMIESQQTVTTDPFPV